MELTKEFSLCNFLGNERALEQFFEVFLLSNESAFFGVSRGGKAWLGTHAMYMSGVQMPRAGAPQVQLFHQWAKHAQLFAVLPRLLVEAICDTEGTPTLSCR